MAPIPVNVVLPPSQIEFNVAVDPTVGNGFTLINLTDVLVHPLAAVPVTVYVVLVAGLTDIGEPLNASGAQVYEAAPVAFKVVDAPAQIVEDVALAPTDGGVLFTVIITTSLDVAELASVIVMV